MAMNKHGRSVDLLLLLIGAFNLVFSSVLVADPTGENQGLHLIIPLQKRFPSHVIDNNASAYQEIMDGMHPDRAALNCDSLSNLLTFIKKKPSLYLSLLNESTLQSLVNSYIASFDRLSDCPAVYDTCFLLRWLSPRVDLIARACNLNLINRVKVDCFGFIDSFSSYQIPIATISNVDAHLYGLYTSYMNNPYSPSVMRDFILGLDAFGHSNLAHSLMGELYQIDNDGLWLTGDYIESQRLIDISLMTNTDAP